MKKTKVMKIGTQDEYLKAVRAASRKEEMELLGPGFHSKDKAHKSKVAYTRKQKHRKSYEKDNF